MAVRAHLAGSRTRRRRWAERLLAALTRPPLRHLRAVYLDPAWAAAAGTVGGAPLVLLPAHRSYLDTLVLDRALREAGLARPWRLAGANLAFWPLGALGRRSGMIFIRREFGTDPAYHAAVRGYLAALLARGQGLEWYPEAGRTRTGRLRPLRNGMPRLLVGAYADSGVEDVLVLPVSIVYDALPDIEAVTAEDAGAAKPPEGIRALIRYLRAGRTEGPRQAWITCAEPISLRALTHDASGDWDAARTLTRRVAIGLREATAVTAESLLALVFAADGGAIGVNAAVGADEVSRQFDALLAHAQARRIPLVRPYSFAAALESLVRTRLLEQRADGFAVVAGRERILAYHRGVVAHWFLPRAAAELVAGGAVTTARISTLLGRPDGFARRVEEELAVLDEGGWEHQPFLLAPRLLGPVLSAYHDAAGGPRTPTPSAELRAAAFALMTAEGLLEPGADAAAGDDFQRELACLTARLRVMAVLDRSRHPGTADVRG
ncbi:1-acyl-sn-glycerol-3-phosphate acyltransferase [Actinospica durhamensis]|uniref:1-acyl-sn-glycerol-3-phosphate acyltransferase n=1 Tax=Actinospica durhamensis TaxID=1508375 RepID=A0A941EZ32_9ACTN|nr:1-acyl-sn-glycerol-3-phosphate acyltransferase [Actinospica durhamensis]MBR7839193.1 1-acyl-sn-glycerol-3-phosphate acyltransferase [Actinospica durhamensis]